MVLRAADPCQGSTCQNTGGRGRGVGPAAAPAAALCLEKSCQKTLVIKAGGHQRAQENWRLMKKIHEVNEYFQIY